jgi:type IV pilus assembly protein PilY1
MTMVFRKTTWACAGLLTALACGAPALADDTELLLVNPDRSGQVPNIMLIIDSSTSMSSTEETRGVYDHRIDYAGGSAPCDRDHYYWTEYEDVVPSCDSSNRRILKSSFLCDHSTRRLQGIGSYRGTMAQYRQDSSGAEHWQTIDPGNAEAPVECSSDEGVHGDGSDSNAVYPQRGSDLAQFTSNPDEGISWGSWPTSQSVTVYDGNYLNYLETTDTISTTRMEIVKDAATAILNSIENVNVGIMRFDDSDGGPVVQAVKDLDTHRATLIDTIQDITAENHTTLSETIYESARYWRGMKAHYGNLVDQYPTDPAALLTTEPDKVYKQPTSIACAKNYTVLLSDGEPTSVDTDPHRLGLVNDLPNWSETLGYGNCTGGDVFGACLDDIAAYLFNDDIDASLPGIQTVTTHAIAFKSELPLLEETASRGGGSYFRADDIASLMLALTEIINDVEDRNLSFAAPAVAVNAFNRTQNVNDLYLTTFAASERVRWPGNLKKYRISDGQIVDRSGQLAVNPDTGTFYDSAQSFWHNQTDGNDVTIGGAVANLPNPQDRKIYTDYTSDPDLTNPSNALTASNATSFDLADFGLTGADGEPSIKDVILWARGEDVQDEDDDPGTTTIRQMGDPLHSQPAAVVYGGDEANPDIAIYTATNQGFLHAIDGETGRELWSFIPKEHLSGLPRFYLNDEAQFKFYGVDGDIVPVVADRDNDGNIEPGDGDFVYLIFGMRRGGNAYYALDVTDRDRPVVKWYADSFGQTWSRPTVARVDMDDSGLNDDKAVVIVGGGYDTAHDSISHPSAPDASSAASIYMLDLQSGEVLWRAGRDDSADLQLAGLTRSIATQIRVIDLSGDGFADRMYASDMGGQLLRFDIFNGRRPDRTDNEALVTGGVVARLGADGLASPTIAATRRFDTAPDVSIFNDNIQNRRFIAISLGSGYRAHPLDNANTDRFYSIRDRNVFNALTQAEYDSFTQVTDAELIEISGQVGTQIGQDQRGWKFTLPPDQKVFSNSVTFNNEIFFVAFSPDTDGAANCSVGVGRNFLYRVSVRNGDPIADLDSIVQGGEDIARVTELAQGGIAPSPTFLFPSPDADCIGEACSPPPISCIGVECFEPGFKNFPVRTLWTQDGVE